MPQDPDVSIDVDGTLIEHEDARPRAKHGTTD
jgi:hypothetical protein